MECSFKNKKNKEKINIQPSLSHAVGIHQTRAIFHVARDGLPSLPLSTRVISHLTEWKDGTTEGNERRKNIYTTSLVSIVFICERYATTQAKTDDVASLHKMQYKINKLLLEARGELRIKFITHFRHLSLRCRV